MQKVSDPTPPWNPPLPPPILFLPLLKACFIKAGELFLSVSLWFQFKTNLRN